MDLMTLLFIALAFVIGLGIGLFLRYLEHKNLKKALWLLYLLRLLLQANMLRLLQTEKVYTTFCEEVQRKARGRVARRAVTAIAGLLPGVGLIDLVVGMGDILEDVTDVADIIANLSVSLPQPKVSVGASLLTLRENAPSQVAESLKALDLEALDMETLSVCVKEAVQGLENSVESMSAAELSEAIEEVVDEFKELGIAYYDYRKMLNFLKKESSSGSTNSHCLNDDA